MGRDDAAATPTSVRRVLALALIALRCCSSRRSVPLVQRFDAQITQDAFWRFMIIFGPACLAAFALRRTPLRMGIALGTLVVAGTFVRFDNRVPIHLERSFFGIHRVMFTGRAPARRHHQSRGAVELILP